MRFKATLTPTSGPGSTISLGDTEIKRVRSVEIRAAVNDITTVKIAVIGIDAIVEGDAAAIYVVDAMSGRRYRLVEVE